MTRRLVVTWALLMGLTILTGIAGVGGAEALGAAWIAVLVVVSIFKGRLILARYLHLERAPSFLGGFTASVVAMMAIVGVSFMVLKKPLMPPRPGVAAPSVVSAPTLTPLGGVANKR